MLGRDAKLDAFLDVQLSQSRFPRARGLQTYCLEPIEGDVFPGHG